MANAYDRFTTSADNGLAADVSVLSSVTTFYDAALATCAKAHPDRAAHYTRQRGALTLFRRRTQGDSSR